MTEVEIGGEGYMIEIWENNEWKQYKILLPYTVNDKKNYDLDNAVVRRYTRDKKIYPPLTPVRLIEGSDKSSWIIENCSNERVAPNLWKQTIVLIEPIEIFKGYYLDNATVTQPINPDSHHPKQSLYDVLTRILKISPTPRYRQLYGTVIDASGFYDNIIFKQGAWLDKFQMTESPEFVFTEATRYDALVEIGLFLDMQPKLEFDENGKLVLYFEELEYMAKQNYTIDKPLIEEVQQPLTNYASEVVSKISNLNITDAVVYPGEGLGIYPNAPEGSYNITEDNAIITLPHKIQRVVKLEIRFSVNPSYDWIDHTEHCLEYGEWSSLPPNTEDRGKIYYHYNDNKLQNLRSYFTEQITKNPFIDNPHGFVRGLLFRVTYIPIVDTKITVGNGASTHHTVIYNQSGNIIDNRAYAEHLRNYIKRMKHGDYVVTQRYNNFREIPEVGHLVNGEYVITNISYSKYPTYYDVTLQLAKEHTRRAEFIRAKEEIRNWEIPADKTVERMITVKEKMYLRFGAGDRQIENKTSIVRDTPSIRRLIPVLANDPNPRTGATFWLLVKTADGSTIPLCMTAVDSTFGTSRLFSFKAPHNVVMGQSKSTSAPELPTKQVGVVYTDRFGAVESMDIGISFSQSHNEIYDFALNYPLSTHSKVNEMLNYRITIRLDDLEVQKDPREILGFIYQLELAPENGEFIGPDALGRLRESDTLRIAFLSTKITTPGAIDYRHIIRSRRVSDVTRYRDTIVYRLPDSFNVPDNYEAVALVLNTLDGHMPLIVNNSPNEQTRLQLSENKSIVLYLNY